jgi:ribosomal subunit interface protein
VRVQIMARHCNVPDALLSRTEEHIQKLSRYDPCVSSAEVIYTEEKRSRKAEVVLNIDRGEPVVARGLRSALDKAMDRITRMLKRERQQHRDHRAPPLPERAPEAELS